MFENKNLSFLLRLSFKTNHFELIRLRRHSAASWKNYIKTIGNYKKNDLGAPRGLRRGWALRSLGRWACPKSAFSLDHPALATKLATNVTQNYRKNGWEKRLKNYIKTVQEKLCWEKLKKNVLKVFPRH